MAKSTVSYRQAAELVQRLEAAGLTREAVQAVIESPGNNLAKQVTDLVSQLTGASGLIYGMFPRPLVQLSNMRHWNERFYWQIPDRHFEDAAAQIADIQEYAFYVPVLMPYLWTTRERAKHLFRVVRQNHPEARSWYGPDCSNIGQVEVLLGAKQPAGLKWMMVNPTAGADQSYDDMDPLSLAGLEVLALAAQAPRWVDSLGTTAEKSVAMAGCRWQVGRWGTTLPVVAHFPQQGRVHITGMSPTEVTPMMKPTLLPVR